MEHVNSFVIKIRTDEVTGKSRSYIQHVSTQESKHFLNLEKMVDFIMNHLGPQINKSGDECGSKPSVSGPETPYD